MKITMNNAFWARVLIAILFVFAGILKLMNFNSFATDLDKRFPLAMLLAVLVVVIEIGVSTLFAIGWQKRWMAWILGGYTAIVTIFYHNPWGAPTGAFDPVMMVAALKNVAIIGGIWASTMCSCEDCEPKMVTV